MKRILLSTVAAIAASGAVAADLPSRKEAPMLTVFAPPTWTGFYAGLNAGYGWGTSSNVPVTAFGSNASAAAFNGLDGIDLGRNHLLTAFAGAGGVSIANMGRAVVDQQGFIGGAQIGYNYQFGRFVVGLETDIQGSAIRGSGRYGGAGSDAYFLGLRHVPGKDDGDNITPFNIANQNHLGGGSIESGVDWLGTVRARVGYTVMPTLMVYGTGGLAYGGVWARQQFTSNATSSLGSAGWLGPFAGLPVFNQTLVGAGRIDQTQIGWTAGAGAEWMIDTAWSLKGEALYYDLGSVTMNGSGAAAPAINLAGFVGPVGVAVPGAGPLSVGTQSRVSFDGVIARVGVNRRFSF